MEKDPYDLDGKSFGIAYNDESAKAIALTATEKTVSGKDRLAGLDLLIRPDVLSHEGVLLVAEGSDITEWTFESVASDRYYLKTEVDGATKYLCFNANGVTLADEPDETASLVKVKPGTGGYSGKWNFSANGYSLSLFSNANNGFGTATGSGASTWLNLVERSVLTDDDRCGRFQALRRAEGQRLGPRQPVRWTESGDLYPYLERHHEAL